MPTAERDRLARTLGYHRVPGTVPRYAAPGEERTLGAAEMESAIWEVQIREDGWHAFARSTRTSLITAARTHLSSRDEARAAAAAMHGSPDVYVFAVRREGGEFVEREHSGRPHRGTRFGDRA